MKKIPKIFVGLFIFCIMAGLSYGQSITGKVSDASNSDALVGAIVKIEGVAAGAEADLDGTYLIENVQPGTYTVEFSYLGYKSKKVTGVQVKAGEVTRLDIALEVEGIETEEITVETSTTLANEQAMLLEQKNSNKVQDGISEQQIKRAPDAAASDVLKRVIGVNIVNDKFVYVRGTSDRYSNTTLNGVQIPSSEPDKKAFSFDLFPSNLLENIIIAKTFTPDQPGNFSGGLVQVTTKEFPEQFSFSYSLTGSYNTQTTGDGFRSYNAGQSKVLFFNSGLDDGGRELPGSIPSNRVISTTYSNQEMKTFGRSFRNNWGQTTNDAPFNGGFQLSIGNKMNFLKNPLGVFAAYSYRNGFSNSEIERNQFNTDSSPLEGFKGQNSEYSVLEGGLLNLSYKLGDNHKIGLKNTFSIASEDVTTYLEGFRLIGSEDNKDFRLYQTKFTERTLISTQFTGDHYFHNFNQLYFSWKGSYSESHRNEPDLKTMTYQRLEGSEDPFSARLGSAADSDGGGRFFSELNDYNRSGALDFEMPFVKIKNAESKIKFGALANTTSRSFDARNFAPRLNGNFYLAYLPVDSIFMAENIDTNKIMYEELTRETDKYRANEENYSGYLMVDIPLDRLRIVTGARFEYNRQQLSTFGRINEPIRSDLKNNDILPSVNLTYSLNEKSNLRASYSQTVSRPELREIAPFGFIDFLSGVKLYGNPDLKRSLIQNYDLRYEIFPAAGEIISVSAFYKNFDSPIEQVYTPGANNPEITFENAIGGARNYGIELELRKNLGFISSILSNVSFNGNITIVDSKVDLEGLQTGATLNDRRLQGQSPYTINVGLYYDNYESGTSVNVLYNKFGRRVSEVGRDGYNDIEEGGNDIIDFSATQRIIKNFELKLSVRDIMGQDKEYYQEVNNVDTVVRRIKSGSGVSLTASYKF